MKSKNPTQQLKELIRKKSITGLVAMSQKGDIQIEEMTTDDPAIGHWMSLVSVFGEKMHLTFKVQFSTNMARIFAQQTFKSVEHGISDSQSKDFIRELCNMVAGYVKNTLVQNSLHVGVSLPLLCRGFDDMFFALPSEKTEALDRWKLVCHGAVVYCSAVIEVNDDLVLNEILDEAADTSGDVEFL